MVATWAPGGLIYGQTFGEWTQAFWTWLMRFTGGAGGTANGASCDLAQTDPDVFFLAGFLDQDGGSGDPGGVTRTCTRIDRTKAILAAPITKLSTTMENPGLGTARLRDHANLAINQVTNMVAILDNTDVTPNLQRVYYSFQLDVRTTPNFFGQGQVSTDAASDGYWLFIKKTAEGGLAAGPHTLQIIGAGIDPPTPNPFTSSVTYTITIT